MLKVEPGRHHSPGFALGLEYPSLGLIKGLVE